MRAILKRCPGPGLELADVPTPKCGRADVLIQVRHAGVCGTDLHIADWDEWAQGRVRPPVVVGHEFAGQVVEVGREVGDEFQPGQLVTAEGHITCGHCRQCRTGNGHICQRTQIIGVDRDGAFAEFIAMPAINVMTLDGIPTTTGAIMDPLGNAFHTVLSPDLSGSTVLVLGCGPIGCFAVGIARAAGAAQVIASDVNPVRLELARKMGAHLVLHAGADDVVARVRNATSGEGVDLVCEMSGHPAAIKQAFQSVRLGGRVHLLGLPKGDVALNLSTDLIFKGVTVYGVVGRKMFETWHQMRSFLSSGLLDPTPVVTHRFPLARIDQALEAIRSGAAGKVILEIGS
ncbi:MAG: L-threonine 3-dehydrogenase [Gemmatimonadetes bacterium]|nr:L-threonine 3-dehydrogenase [Gemmatimonadota bacterium]